MCHVAHRRFLEPGTIPHQSTRPVSAAKTVPANAPIRSHVAARGAAGNLPSRESTSSPRAPK
jgi:hypothetical protein